MKELDEMKFYETIGKANGWNFSQLRVSADQAGWEFHEEVIKRCSQTDWLLDIGTGGGENLLKMASSVGAAIGIDLSNGMITAAIENLRKSEQTNVRFVEMSSKQLHFPQGFFDIVTCRHAPFDPTEVAKVMKMGGVFLTQQVSEDDKVNIKNAFGRGQSFGDRDGTLKEKYMQELKDAGFTSIKAYEYNAAEYYERPEDLLFLLEHTPIIPRFGQEKNDTGTLKAFIENHQTAKGICTNSKRFLIVAVKETEG